MAAQIEAPYEVIVVDNNCTDDTIRLARKYKFVRIVRERKQGLIAARNRGFNLAKGDILCRIDADAVLAPDWTKVVRQTFEARPEIVGLTGLASTRVLPRIPILRTTFYSKGYFWWVWYLFRCNVLWGANMAMRRWAWGKVRGTVNLQDNLVHEDQDLSLCLMYKGFKLRLEPKMLIKTDGQTYNYAPKLISYIRRAVDTRRLAAAAGHWPVPAGARLPARRTAFATLMVYTLGVGFLLSSILLWPLDKLMIAWRRDAWLD